MTKYLIYLATNLINGKQYVGQTKFDRLDHRIREHLRDAALSDHNVACHNAINKYGWKNFKTEILIENEEE